MKFFPDQSLWVEKYRPTVLEDYICSDESRLILEKWISTQDIPHILLSSDAGRGKTSLAKLLVENIKCEYKHIDCSVDRSIDTVREKMVTFASGISLKGIKIVICDEADGLTADAQRSLKGVTEKYQKNTRFIFTTNHIDNIIPPLRDSRFVILDVTKPPINQIKVRCAEILTNEGVEYDPKDITGIVNLCYPDIRNTIHTLQQSVVANRLVPSESRSKFIRLDEELFPILLRTTNKSVKFNELFQLITDLNIRQYELIYKLIFKRIDKFSDNIKPDITILLAEYLKSDTIVPDRQINCMAMLSQIIKLM